PSVLTGLVLQALRSRKSCMNQAADANLFSRLFEGLDNPARLAIETHDGAHISYGDLIARAGQMANVLVARGVKPGDRVAVQVEKSVANIVLYLATVRAGAVYLPLNTAYTLNELDYFIGDAEPSHPRPVRGDQCDAVCPRLDDLPAEARPGSDHQIDGARHGADGRADLLHAAAAKPCAVARDHQAHATVHLGLGTAAG